MTAVACSRCGASIASGARFCSRCGHDVSGERGGVATAGSARPSFLPDPQAELMARLRAATLGEYDILEELGQGGMATVFLAHDIALDRRVAVKVMSPALRTDSMVARFKREARTSASLSHRHIIPIYAVRETRDLLYFVMKFVDGRALDRIIREQGPLPVPMVQAIVTQVGSALGYAHRRGIIHRDIKPANILLDEEGSAIVTDFGIAKVPDAQALTMTGVTVGTPTYMSPEQGMGVKEISTASDQYSLGIVTFEMLAGKVPFEADSMMGIMWHHFNSPPPVLLERRSDCPPALADAVTRMLAKDPRARFASMEQAIAMIGDPPWDDPIRDHIRRLSCGSSDGLVAAQFHTPASPVPAGARGPLGAPPSAASPVSPDAPTLPAVPFPAPPPSGHPTPDASTPRRSRLPLLLGAPTVAAAIVVGGWLVLTQRGAPPDTAAPPAQSPVAVPQPPAHVARIMMTPSSTTSITVGGTVQLHAVPLESGGGALGGQPVAWRSDDPTVARVTGDGTVTGIAAGRATIVATIAGARGGATVTVTTGRAAVASVALGPPALVMPVGDSAVLHAEPRDRAGTLLGDRRVAWSVDKAGVLRLAEAGTGGTATITALAEGVAAITAAAEGAQATVRVTVRPPAVARVAIGPPPPLHPRDTVTLAVELRDARGARLTKREVAWRSADDAVATVSPAGLVTARAEGATTIGATVEGRSAEVAIAVTPAPPGPVAAAAPAAPSGLVLRAGTLAAGAEHTCGVTDGGGTICWGANDRGQLGAPVQAQLPAPVAAAVPGNLSGLVSGATHTCGLRPDGTAVCWGTNTDGQLGAGPIDARRAVTTPVTVTGDRRYAALAAGASHTCGIVADSTAWCWGRNADGQLGDDAKRSSGVPVAVEGGHKFRAIAAGAKHTCAATGAGKVYCWGDGFALQLGRGIEEQWSHPIEADLQPPIGRLSARGTTTCALARDGTVWCWGGNRRPPEQVATRLKFTELAAGNGFACGLTAAGEAWCWGRNADGQLGDGSGRDQRAPVRVRSVLPFASLAAGDTHVCALAQGGLPVCWGGNRRGQLGTGTLTGEPVPVPVQPLRRP